MQKVLFIHVFLTFIMISCSRELPERKVPSLVQNAFRTRFMGAKDIDWKKNGQLYVVEFEQKGSDEDHKILFDTLGSMVMYKYEITSTMLPAEIIDVINTRYSDYRIDEAENLVKDGVNYYQVELERGQKKQHLVFSANGLLNNQVNYWD